MNFKNKNSIDNCRCCFCGLFLFCDFYLIISKQNNDSKIIKYNMDLEKIETEYNINSCAIQYDVVGNKLYIVNFDDEIVEYTIEKDKLTEKNRTEVEVDDNEYISAMYAK